MPAGTVTIKRSFNALLALPEAAPGTRTTGALNALKQKRTAYSDARFAVPLLQKANGQTVDHEDVAEALFSFLDNPGEGMWSIHLSKAVALLAGLDPDPDRLVALYARILTDPVYEQRGEPRVAVCRALAGLGPRASELRPALEAAAERERELVRIGRHAGEEKSMLPAIEEALRALPHAGQEEATR